MPAALSTLPWAWTWGPPNGPSRTAHFGDNPVFDTARVILCICAFIMVAMTLRAVAEQNRRHERMDWSQMFRFLAQGVVGVLIGVDMAYTVGTTAGPRMLACAVFIILATLGVLGKRKKQLHEPVIDQPPRRGQHD